MPAVGWAAAETAQPTSEAATVAPMTAARRARPARDGEEWMFDMVISYCGQLVVAGSGSIRMYVIGPVMFAPHEVIWYRAWLCEMM